VNIGDIEHTSGGVALLQKYFPEAEITLWLACEGQPAKRRPARFAATG